MNASVLGEKILCSDLYLQVGYIKQRSLPPATAPQTHIWGLTHLPPAPARAAATKLPAPPGVSPASGPHHTLLRPAGPPRGSLRATNVSVGEDLQGESSPIPGGGSEIEAQKG